MKNQKKQTSASARGGEGGVEIRGGWLISNCLNFPSPKDFKTPSKWYNQTEKVHQVYKTKYISITGSQTQAKVEKLRYLLISLSLYSITYDWWPSSIKRLCTYCTGVEQNPDAKRESLRPIKLDDDEKSRSQARDRPPSHPKKEKEEKKKRSSHIKSRVLQ